MANLRKNLSIIAEVGSARTIQHRYQQFGNKNKTTADNISKRHRLPLSRAEGFYRDLSCLGNLTNSK